MIITQSTDRLSPQELTGYVESGRAEDTTLEYKQQLYEGSDEGKKEFVKDVTSMANTAGGHIIVGITDEDGCACSFKPIVGIDLDIEITRLFNLCRDCIEPNLLGIDIYPLEVEGGHLLVIKIPKSWSAPHRANSKKSKLFYQRHSRSVSEMDVNQLRQAFIGAQSAFEKADKLSKTWAFNKKASLEDERIEAWEDALKKGISGEELDNVRNVGPRDGVALLHFIPIGNLAESISFSLDHISGFDNFFRPPSAHGFSTRINLEGIKYYVSGIDADVHTQLHRNGSVEIIHEQLLWQQDGKRELLGRSICEILRSSLVRTLNGMHKIAVLPPLFIRMHILQVNHSVLDTGQLNSHWSLGAPRFEKDDLVLPPVILTDYPDENSLAELYHQLTDPLWNAYGRSKCSIEY